MSTLLNHAVLGVRIKNLRLNMKMTRENLAELLDVSTRFLADVEAGKVGISIATLIRVCHVLHTSADYLLGLVELSADDQELLAISRKLENIDKSKLPYIHTILDTFIEATR